MYNTYFLTDFKKVSNDHNKSSEKVQDYKKMKWQYKNSVKVPKTYKIELLVFIFKNSVYVCKCS